MQNPILTLVKIAIFGVLALLVLLSFIQENKQETRTNKLFERISGVESSVERLSTRIAKLDRRVQSGVVTNGGGGAEDAVPPAGEMERFAWSDTPPSFLKGRAKELWGTYGENYLKPDPDWPEYPSLDDPKLDPEGKINIWYGSAPPYLNPWTLSDSAVNTRIRIPTNLFMANSHSKNPYFYKPSLAYRVEVDPEYKTWIFWIRPGVRWHTPQVDLERYPHLKDDHYVTAHDWKFTLDMVTNKDVRCAHWRAYLDGFDRCEVVDDHCFIMHWEKSSFTSINANLELMQPFPKFVYGFDERGEAFDPATIGSQLNEHWMGTAFKWVGCGPYYLEHFDPESEMRLRRFDDWYGDMPAIKVIQREIFPGRETANTKFEAGEMAYSDYLAPHFNKRVKDRAEFKTGRWKVHWIWSTSYGFIGYKNTHPIFRDVKVRRAMTHACNRQRIMDVTLDGKGKICTGPQYYFAPTCPKDIKPIPYDLKKASALLAEAGWKDADGNGTLEKDIDGTVTEFRVSVMQPKTGFFKTVFEIFKEDLAKIGIQMNIEIIEWGQFSKRLDDRDFEITALFWNTPGWDSDMGQLWHSSMVDDLESSNFVEFADPEVDRLIEKARTEFDLDERVKVQGACHRRIHDLQPYTFLFTAQLAAVWWTEKLSNMADADQWTSKPRVRLWPLYVPSKK